MKHIYLAIVAAFLVFNSVAQSVAGFDDLVLAPEKFWNGSDQTGSFKSGDITFRNSNAGPNYWSGFAYSNMSDITTAGYLNQYSAITGRGSQESPNYAVCYPSPTATAEFKSATKVSGLYLTNSTYAYLSMKNGDQFSKKFGGVSGNDPDFLKLMIEALNAEGKPVDTVNFYLADFRFADHSKDYILDKWTWLDLSEIKEAYQLRFSLSSSDNGTWGMNTPGYFCIDNLNYQSVTSAPEMQQVQVLAYPNPFEDQFTISGLKENANVTLSDISGRTIRQYITVSNNIMINGLGNLKPGVYFLKITDGMNHFTTKLMKK